MKEKTFLFVFALACCVGMALIKPGVASRNDADVVYPTTTVRLKSTNTNNLKTVAGRTASSMVQIKGSVNLSQMV